MLTRAVRFLGALMLATVMLGCRQPQQPESPAEPPTPQSSSLRTDR